MKIGLINIDSKLPNIALHKCALYHSEDEVVWDMPIEANSFDKMYVSCIYSWNKHKALNYQMHTNAIIGGSGVSLKDNLPDEIERMRPKINYGFTTRGCIRKCPFCIVPDKEGFIRATGDVYDFWDGKSKWVILFDNNILALPEHFKLICQQIQKHNLKSDFNQGLDIRLLTEEQALILNKMKPLKQWRFAFDDIRYEKAFRRGAKILKKVGINPRSICVYVLAGFNSDIDDCLYRINIIHREYGFDPFLMLYKSPENNPTDNQFRNLKSIVNLPLWKKHRSLRDLSRWVNRKTLFHTTKWEDYKIKTEKEEGQQALFGSEDGY